MATFEQALNAHKLLKLSDNEKESFNALKCIAYGEKIKIYMFPLNHIKNTKLQRNTHKIMNSPQFRSLSQNEAKQMFIENLTTTLKLGGMRDYVLLANQIITENNSSVTG